MNEKLLDIGEVADMLSVSIDTLRRWDKKGILKSFRPTPTSNRYYFKEDLDRFLNRDKKTEKRDLATLAKDWAKSKTPSNPPDEYYCINSDIFKARHQRLDPELSANPDIKKLSPLISATAGEIGNNSFDHNLGNWPDIPGILFGYDIAKRQVVLADRGQGVLKTLKKVLPKLKNDKDALSTAFTKIITGRYPEGRGNGLKFVREIITNYPLHLFFQTGNAQLELKQNDKKLRITKSKSSFHGCIAIINF